MNEVAAFLSELNAKGMFFKVEGEHLLLQGIKDEITEATKNKIRKDAATIAYIRDHKAAIIEYLKDRPVIEELSKLSPLQEGIFFHSLYNPESLAYTEQFVCEIRNSFNENLLRQAWEEAVQEHTILRTAFIYSDTAFPLQCVFKNVSLPFDKLDFSMLSSEDCANEKKSLLAQDLSSKFDLSKAPLLRFTLIRESEQLHTLVWTYHHIIMDGWSFALLTQKVLHRYEDLLSGRKAMATKVDRYSDYIHFVDRQRQIDPEVFWKKYVNTIQQPSLLPFHTGAADRNGGSTEYNSVSLCYDKDFSHTIKHFLQKYHLTASTLIQAVWGFLILKYTNQQVGTFGCVVSGRPEELLNSEDRIGLYINTLPFVVNYENASVKDWMQKMFRSSAEMRKYSYTRLTDIKKLTPLTGEWFDTLLAFENYPEPIQSEQSKSLDIRFIEATERSNYMLTVVCSLREVLHVNFVYNDHLLTDDTMQRVRGHFDHVLKQLIDDADRDLNQIELITPHERELIMKTYNPEQCRYPEVSLPDLFKKSSNINRSAIALSFLHQQINYDQLDRLSNRMANDLLKRVSKGDRIAICLERSAELVISIIAVLKTGCAYVPIDPLYPQARIDFIIGDSGVKSVITEPTFYHLFSPDAPPFFSASESIASASSDKELDVIIDGEMLAYIIYTSGTTGKPKGSLITHRNVVRLFFSDRPLFDFGPNDTWTMFHSPAFDFSVWEIFGALLYGGRLVIVPKEVLVDTYAFSQLLVLQHVTVLNQTPSAFHVLQEIMLAESMRHQLRYVIFGGEALAPGLLKDWFLRYPDTALINMYGITETTVHVTYKKISHNDILLNKSTIGRAIPTLNCYVVDTNNQLLPVGVPGELCVSGEGLSIGYLNSPELTSQKFISGKQLDKSINRIYKSGDLACWLPDGSLEYLGRIDDQVKIRGYRIELKEIERTILLNDQVEQCAVLTTTGREKKIAAFYKGNVDANRLEDQLRKTLPDYMIPQRWIEVESIPLTLHGKVDRTLLLTRINLDENTSGNNTEILTDTERFILPIWRAVLGNSSLGVNDNFFEAGGHSLTAVQLAFRIRTGLKIEMTIKDIFIHQTVKSIGQFLEKSSVEETLPIRITEHPYYPLTPSQVKLWALQQLNPKQTAYTITSSFIMKGALHAEYFVEAVRNTAASFRIFKTRVRLHEGIPVQSVLGDEVNVLFQDLISRQDAAVKAKEIADQLRYKAFDLEHDSLIRISFIKIDHDEYVFLLNIHHIIFDGWSLNVFYKHVNQNYQSLISGKPLMKATTKYDFLDYTLWLEEHLEKKRNALLDFWRTEVIGIAAPVLPLKTTHSTVTSSFSGDTIKWTIPDSLSAAIQKMANTNGATLFSTLLAVVRVFHFRTTGQKETVIVSPFAGQGHGGLQELIGYFVNTIPIRLALDPLNDFTAAVMHEQNHITHLLSWMDLPADAVIDELYESISTSTTELYKVMVVLQNSNDYEGKTPGLPGITYKPFEVDNQESRFDLTFNFSSIDQQGLVLNIDFNTATYKRNEVEVMMRYFQYFLQSVVDTPKVALIDLEYIPLEEQVRILEEYNRTDKTYLPGHSVSSVFSRMVTQYPDHRALFSSQGSHSYNTLCQAIDEFTLKLYQWGVRRGYVVVVSMNSSQDLIVTLMALWKIGAVYVPVVTEHPSLRKQLLIASSGAKFVIVDSSPEFFVGDHISVAEYGHIQTLVYEKTIEIDAIISVEAKDTAYIIFTSGTTGEPKGVPISHKSLVDRILYHIDYLSMTESDRFVQFASLGFDASLAEILIPLMSGGTLVIPAFEEKKNTRLFIDLINTQKVTAAIFSPSFLEELQYDPLTSVRLIISTGEAASLQQAVYYSKSKSFYNGYGPTETCFGATFYKMDEHATIDVESVPIGRPFANTRIYILDAFHRAVGHGVTGEIAIAGIGLSDGYLNNPELTNQKFIANYYSKDTRYNRLYLTGDRGRWTENGEVEYLGRADDQVQIFGVRVELGEIEAHLKKIKGIVNAVVLFNEEKLVAFIATEDTIVLSGNAIRAMLSKELPRHLIPATIQRVERFPTTLNGKIDKPALLRLMTISSEVVNKPVSPFEELVSDVWKKVLQLDAVDVEQHFMEYGGSSLKAIKLISRVYEHLKLRVTLHDIYNFPTIRSFTSQFLTKNNNEREEIVLYEDQEYYPLSEAQKRIWVLQQYDENSPLFNMYSVHKWSGKLQVDLLENCLNNVADRYDVLKSNFRKIHGEPVVGSTTTTININFLRMENNENSISRFIGDLVRVPFHKESDVLLKTTVIQAGEELFYIVLVTHHLISDGWSMQLLLKEIVSSYIHGVDSKGATKTSFQFKDHAIGQLQPQAQATINKARNYWLEQLAGANGNIDLMINRAHSTVRTFEGDKIEFFIDTDTFLQVKHLATQNNVSAFTVLLSCLYLMIYERTGIKDITIGTDSAGRYSRHLEDQLGMFLNTLCLRLKLRKTISFVELLNDVQHTLHDAISHEHYPFNSLVEDFKKEDNRSSPLFNVFALSQLLDGINNSLVVPDVSIESLNMQSGHSKFDVSFIFGHSFSNDLVLSVEYNTSLYSSMEIEELADHFIELLTYFSNNQDQRIDSAPTIFGKKRREAQADFLNSMTS